MKRSKKGFTLAELLIVIAIIAVLVAIMIPVFGAQLNKARAAAELANVRAKYAEMLADKMLAGNFDGATNPTYVIDADVLASALQYTGSSITCKNGTGSVDANGVYSEGDPGSVTVKYGGISGSFNTDSDVTFSKTTEITK